MPRDEPKFLGRVEPLLQNKLDLARRNPMSLVVVAEDITPTEAKNLMARMRAMRKGLQKYEPINSELWQMGDNRRLLFNTEYSYDRPSCRTVTMQYLGLAKPMRDMTREELNRALGYSES